MVLSEEYIRRIILQEISNTISANPTEYDLAMSFNKINKSFFNDCLPKCKFNLKLNKNYMGLFKYDGINAENETLINPIISVNGAYQYNTLQLDSIMAHEMIHYYLAYAHIDMQCTHGEAFQDMANEMNSELGLNIEEEVDTGNIQYGQSQKNMFKPSTELIGYMQSYMNSFSKYSQQITQILNTPSTVGLPKQFIRSLLTFTNSMINALQRCVNKQSINEANGNLNVTALSDFKHGFREGYYDTKNIITYIYRLKHGGTTFNATYDSNGDLRINKTIKLVELLYKVLPTLITYGRTVNKNNILSKYPCIDNVIIGSTDLRNRIEKEINGFNGGQNSQDDGNDTANGENSPTNTANGENSPTNTANGGNSQTNTVVNVRPKKKKRNMSRRKKLRKRRLR